MLLQRVQAIGGPPLEPGWRYFSLTQVNNKREGWTVWQAPEEEVVRGRAAFKAAEAARRQGAFERLHMRLLEARHRDGRDIDDEDVVMAIAAEAEINVERFREDFADPALLQSLARDHQQAVAEHGVFGTPTFVFPAGSAYVRLSRAPEGAEATKLFDELVAIIAGEPALLEIKRPKRREPDES